MIDINALINAIVSHASTSGHFAQVQGHEPKSMPMSDGPDLMYAVFLSTLGPTRTASGLAATSARVELTGRIYMPFRSEPEDLIDPTLAEATDALFEAYTADFDLGSHARNVDVMGGQGNPLSARAGYQNVDGTTYRVMDIVIPIIVNDAWPQGD